MTDYLDMNYCNMCGKPLLSHSSCDNYHCKPKENSMEKHGYTVKHQAGLLSDQLDQLIDWAENARDNLIFDVIYNLHKSVPDYGGMASPGMSDIVDLVNRASNTATCLQTLIMLAAIENKQL